MFRAADVGKVWVPVDLPTGGEDGSTIWLHQQLFTRKELRDRERAVAQRAADGALQAADQLKAARQARIDGTDAVDPTESMEAMFDRIEQVEAEEIETLLARTSNWKDVVGDNDMPVPFSTERLAALLEYDWFAKAARKALYTTSREGVAKNSQPGAGGSPARLQA